MNETGKKKNNSCQKVLLNKRNRELKDIEDQLQEKHEIKTFLSSQLGQGKINGGGKEGRKVRFEVLDRMALLGAKLSPQQRIDWKWWKEEWDERMLEVHKDNWGETFSEWMQHVLNEMTEPMSNNAFSIFVRNETVRVLSGVKGLRMPGVLIPR